MVYVGRDDRASLFALRRSLDESVWRPILRIYAQGPINAGSVKQGLSLTSPSHLLYSEREAL